MTLSTCWNFRSRLSASNPGEAIEISATPVITSRRARACGRVGTWTTQLSTACSRRVALSFGGGGGKKTKLSQAYVVSDEPVRRLNDVTFDQLTSFIAAARAAPAVTNFASTLLMSDSIGIRHQAVAACGRNDVGGTIRERKPCRGVGERGWADASCT